MEKKNKNIMSKKSIDFNVSDKELTTQSMNLATLSFANEWDKDGDFFNTLDIEKYVKK